MPLRELANGRVLTALIMLLIFSTMSLMALGFPERASLMPLMVGVPGVLLALTQLIIEVRATLAGAAATEETPVEVRRAERQMFTWLLLFFAGILVFGFLYAAPLLVFSFLWLAKREPVSSGLIGAAATWAVLYGLFETAFEIPLFDGLLAGWLWG